VYCYNGKHGKEYVLTRADYCGALLLRSLLTLNARSCLLEEIVHCSAAHALKSNVSLRSSLFSDIRTKRRIALTGTPAQNKIEELYHGVHCVCCMHM
jgi:hypothetical protein